MCKDGARRDPSPRMAARERHASLGVRLTILESPAFLINAHSKGFSGMGKIGEGDTRLETRNSGWTVRGPRGKSRISGLNVAAQPTPTDWVGDAENSGGSVSETKRGESLTAGCPLLEPRVMES